MKNHQKPLYSKPDIEGLSPTRFKTQLSYKPATSGI
jgi:hypothetical protein